jgi:hypothetical protein
MFGGLSSLPSAPQRLPSHDSLPVLSFVSLQTVHQLVQIAAALLEEALAGAANVVDDGVVGHGKSLKEA